MNWFVYGFLPGQRGRTEPQMTALVGVHKKQKDAAQSRDIENQCWSDEGLIFQVESHQLVVDSTYEELCERVAK